MLSQAADDNTGSHTVLAEHVIDFGKQSPCGAPGQIQAVPAISLDQILRQFARVKLLKLDCEGSEFPILFTSRELHRVEEIVGEVHEIGQESMALLHPGALVPGYGEYRVRDLVAALEAHGFAVETRPGDPHMCVFSARRAPAS
jgi:hypothetical protein